MLLLPICAAGSVSAVVAESVSAPVVGVCGEFGRDAECMRGLLRSPGITGLVLDALLGLRFCPS